MNALSSQGLAGPTEQSAFLAPVAKNAGRGSNVRQYLRIAVRRRRAIAGTVAAAVLLGLIATLLMTPQYTATATIEISRESDQVTNFQGVERETSIADQEFYQTQYGLLRAGSLAERVAEELKLVDDVGFFEMFDAPSNEPAMIAVDGRYPADGRAMRRRIAGEILLDNLSVAPMRMSRLVDLRFSSPDPAFSAKVANTWSEDFIKMNLERKVQATSYGRKQLEQQLAEYKDRLDQSQQQLVGYASAEKIINLPSVSGGDGSSTAERPIVVDNLAALNSALAQATADRIQAEARYRQAGSSGSTVEALGNQAINTLRERRALLAAQYQELMVRFEPGYPAAQAIQSQIAQLDQSIAREESRVNGALRSRYDETRASEAALKSKVGELESEFLDLRRRSIQYNVYQQEVDTNQALYDSLLQRFKEIGVAGGVGVNNVSVVDPADVPQDPSSPKIFLNILISLLVGLGLGAALAFILEQMHEAISDPSDIEETLGLPLLGTVPNVSEGPEEALLDRKSELVDAYLAILTSLGLTTEHGIPRAFAVTSTSPAEGKSTTSISLATTIARGGRRVILVDGDLRSPSVHHLASVRHDHGVSNFLTGDDDIKNMVVRIESLGIDAMTAGPIPPNAAELLSGDRFSVLLERLLAEYDHVVVDCPPVMGLADALLIANVVEGVVYTVEANSMRSSTIKAAVERLSSVNARLFGGILTKFDPKKSAYGYGYEYGYNYGREETSPRTT